MILVILGPGGSGKTTLRKSLTANGFSPVIGCTTRKMRPGEREGQDYYFISESEYFNDDSLILKRRAGEKLYGMRRYEFTKEGNPKVMISSVNGILELEKMEVNLSVCFLNIPRPELINRMFKRGDTKKEIEERMNIDEGKFDIQPIKSPLIVVTEGTVAVSTRKCIFFIGS